MNSSRLSGSITFSAGIPRFCLHFLLQMKRAFSPRVIFYLLVVGFWAGLDSPQICAKGVAEHVVVVVWDGMRPDFITPQYCPMLYSLAQEGVYFRNHHPAYISST